MKLSNAHRDDAIHATTYKNDLDSFYQLLSQHNFETQKFILEFKKILFKFNKLVPNIKLRILYMMIAYETLNHSHSIQVVPKLLNHPEVIVAVLTEQYQIPKLPVNGNDLGNFLNCTPETRKLLRFLIQRLDQVYLDHDLNMSKQELLDASVTIFQEIQEETANKKQERKNRKRERSQSQQRQESAGS